MLHPSYTDLMKVVNKDVEEGETKVVNSRYSIVMATSKRARQIIDGEMPLVNTKEGEKPLSIAIDELNSGKIKIIAEDTQKNKKRKADALYGCLPFKHTGRNRMKLLFVSLGCDKNLVDTEVMLGLLDKRGWQITDDETQADVIVINTCCFVHDAKEESIQTILEMAEYKKTGSLKALIVTGCLAQRYQEEIVEEIPEVDAVLGTTSYDKIADAIDGALEGNVSIELADVDALPLVETRTSGNHRRALCVFKDCGGL